MPGKHINKKMVTLVCCAFLIYFIIDIGSKILIPERRALVIYNKACHELNQHVPLQVLINLFGAPSSTVEKENTHIYAFGSKKYALMFGDTIQAEIEDEREIALSLSCGKNQKVF